MRVEPGSRILITGGAGFIGSHLCSLLLDNGYLVRVLDNFSSGSLENLDAGNPRLEILQGNVEDPVCTSQAVKGVSAVVHLAAVASVQASVDAPDKTHHANFSSTLTLLEQCCQHSIKRVIYASSAAVYGTNETLPISEKSCPLPLTPYAVDKLAGEYYLQFYQRQYDLEAFIFRFFNVYGPRQNPYSPYSGIISILNHNFRNNIPITIYGDGEQTRDFIYVTDLAAILFQSLTMAYPGSQATNIGTSTSTSLNQLLDIFSIISGNRPSIQYDVPRPGDIRHSRADNRRLKQVYTPQPFTSMEQGLKLLYSY